MTGSQPHPGVTLTPPGYPGKPIDIVGLVKALGRREFVHHVWSHRGDGILQSLHAGPRPDDAYAPQLPDDIRQARTGVRGTPHAAASAGNDSSR